MTEVVSSNFLRQRIEQDLEKGTYATRRWAGKPGNAQTHSIAPLDAAKIRTRFPPEPNGYLHVGHAKSICLNFSMAQQYGGQCHMRFDDTNPEKENLEYVNSILDAVRWLGFDADSHQYYASDYFDEMYAFAEYLISAGHAYVDSQSADAMRANRGTLTQAGIDSPFRARTIDENLALFREMRAGKHPEGSHVLRVKIDMASPNINLRDPAIYRIRFAHHHRTGDTWCIYPMYDYAHPIEDALENITHSICTLEFQDHRPFYDWLLERIAQGGLLQRPVPQQIEFARLNLNHAMTSKRKLLKLVEQGVVEGWDDPRMPTIVGLRRRGYTPEAIRLFCERIGVSKADSWIEYQTLEQSLRDVLEPSAPRATAVLKPLKLVIDNIDAGLTIACKAPVHPNRPELGERKFNFSKELWIEQDDFALDPPKGFFRLYVGSKVRLRYGFVIECTGVEKGENGQVMVVHANYFSDSQSGTPGSANYKVKGNIQWLSANEAVPAELRLYTHLFKEEHPGSSDAELMETIDPNSCEIVKGLLEPGMVNAKPWEVFQFERYGYFVCDPQSVGDALRFNRSVGLKDSFKN